MPHDPAEYGRHTAQDYDQIYGSAYDTDAAVRGVAELAGPGPVLEFGIGTGRLALALSQLGVAVEGIEGSPEMVAGMREKPRGDAIPVAVGDFSSIELGRRFRLVLLAVNTIFALPDQATQVRCFENAARHLEPGGRFVVEAWVPEPGLPAGRSLRPRDLGGGLAGLVVADHDPVNQVLSTTQVVLGGEVGVRVFPVVHRYAWPAELDLMARIAGLELERRTADWTGAPFGPTSAGHVSVYRSAGHPGE